MIDELKSFIQVVENQNFTKAAKKLNLTQPAVSLHVSGLEKMLDTVLILRSNKEKHFILTPEGKILYERAKSLVNQYEEMIAEIKSQRNNVSGTLKIGASLTIGEYLLPNVLAQLSKQYPELKFEVIIENSHAILEKVDQLELEIGLVETEEVVLQLNRTPFYQDTLQLAYSDSIKLPQDAQLYTDYLSKQTWLLRESGSGTRQMTDRFLQHQGISPKNQIILGSNYLIKETLIQQPTVTFTSDLMKKQRFQGICFLEEQTYELSRLFYYVTKQGIILSKRVQCFIEVLDELYAKQNK